MKGFAEVQSGVAGDITAGRPLGRWTEELSNRLQAELEIFWEEVGLSGEEFERQRHEVADKHARKISAGELYYPYVTYPYIEWYSGKNGRVVLELDASQVEVISNGDAVREKTPKEMIADKKRRAAAMTDYMTGMVKELSKQNRESGGDGNVQGLVVG